MWLCWAANYGHEWGFEVPVSMLGCRCLQQRIKIGGNQSRRGCAFEALPIHYTRRTDAGLDIESGHTAQRAIDIGLGG